MENTQKFIVCSSLSKHYKSIAALDSLDLTLPQGKIIGLLGPNGSGKTTLLKLLAGLIIPTRGSVTIDGHVPGAETKAIVSYLPDKSFFASWMSVKDCLDIFDDFYSDFDRAHAEHMLSLLSIDPKRTYKSLSKGNQEKVQLICAMARRAKLYLLDEPIAGVDPAAREYILSTIFDSYYKEATILISTHLLADVETVLDEFIFLKNGRCVAYNSVENSREETGKSLDELFREVFRCY